MQKISRGGSPASRLSRPRSSGAKKARLLTAVTAAGLLAAACESQAIHVSGPVGPNGEVAEAAFVVVLPEDQGMQGMEASQVATPDATEPAPEADATRPEAEAPAPTEPEQPEAPPPAGDTSEPAKPKPVPPTPEPEPPAPPAPPAPKPEPPAPAPAPEEPAATPPQRRYVAYETPAGSFVVEVDEFGYLFPWATDTPGWSHFTFEDGPDRVEIKVANNTTGENAAFIATTENGEVTALFRTDTTPAVTVAPSSESTTAPAATGPSS